MFETKPTPIEFGHVKVMTGLADGGQVRSRQGSLLTIAESRGRFPVQKRHVDLK